MEKDIENYVIEDGAIKYEDSSIYSFESRSFDRDLLDNREEYSNVKKDIYKKYPYLEPFIEEEKIVVGNVLYKDNTLKLLCDGKEFDVEGVISDDREETVKQMLKAVSMVNAEDASEVSLKLTNSGKLIFSEETEQFIEALENSGNDADLDKITGKGMANVNPSDLMGLTKEELAYFQKLRKNQ